MVRPGRKRKFRAEDDEFGSASEQEGANAGDDEKPKGKKAKILKPEDRCFIMVCEKKKLKNHKWCDDHRRLTDNMSDQAKQSGKEAMKLLNITFMDRQSATSAVTEFEGKCPAKWGRKPLIDWSQFRRTYGVSTTWRIRDSDQQMTLLQYIAHFEKLENGGIAPELSKENWAALKESTPEKEHEYQGNNLMLFVEMPKQRHRDRDVYNDAKFEEGSKRMKGSGGANAQTLKDFCHDSKMGFGNRFFKGLGGLESHQPPPRSQSCQQANFPSYTVP